MSFIQWNAKISVDGARYKFIGLGWGMEDDRPSGINKYQANITVEAHPSAVVKLVRKLPNENVVTKNDPALSYGPAGIELRVTYNVKAKKPTKGTTYATVIAWHAGVAQRPDGFLSGVGTQPLGQDFVVTVTV